MVGKYIIEKIARVSVTVDIASEFRYRDPLISEDDLMIVISQSGETADTNGTFDSALEAAKKILEEQPDVTAIMCGNDQMAVAAKTALNLANNDQTVVYSVDGSPDIKKELMKADSQIAGTVAQSPINIGKKAVDIALNVLDGKDFEAETAIDVFMINKDNVEMYGADGWQ